MKKFNVAFFSLLLSCFVAPTTWAAANNARVNLTLLAKQAENACESPQSKRCQQWQDQLQHFILQHPDLSIEDFIHAADQLDQTMSFDYLGKQFFLEQAERVYFNAIKQSHIDYLKQPSIDELPGVSETYKQSLSELQKAEQYKTNYIQAMCAPVRSAWAGGSGLNSAYADCKLNFSEFNLKFLIETWAEFNTQ